jgi:proline iminopeptidase
MGIVETISIQSGNIRLPVNFYARKGAETVVLLHGGPGVPDEMTEVKEWLSAFMQVITFEQRGIGLEDPGNCSFTIADYLNDIESIRQYFNLKAIHLFGHSWGGLYAQLYANDFPMKVSSLFLCSPASGTGRLWNITEKEIFRYNYERSTFKEWIGMGINTALGMLGSQRAYRQLFRQIIINYHKGYNVPPPDEQKLARISSIAGTFTRSAIRRHPDLEIFGKTSYPVIITYGEFDAYGKSKEFVFRRFPYARKAIIPASGHTPWKHNPVEFSKIVNDFYFRQ